MLLQPSQNISESTISKVDKSNFESLLKQILEESLLNYKCSAIVINYTLSSEIEKPIAVFSFQNSISETQLAHNNQILVELLKNKSLINITKTDISRNIYPDLLQETKLNSGCLAIAINNAENKQIAILQLLDRLDDKSFTKLDEISLVGLAQIISQLYNFSFLKNTRFIQLKSLLYEKIAQQKEISGLEKEIQDLIKENEILENQSMECVQLAQYDKLTGLYNRAGLEDRLDWLINHAERNNQKLAVALLDLDHFKQINDTLGHETGDTLLKIVSARIRKNCRKIDTVGRLGGDEFVIIINNVESQNIAFDILQKITHAIAESINLDHRSYEVTSSIGFSLYPQDGQTPKELLHFADSAMYQAKKNGRANFQYYSQELQKQIQARIEMESELNSAIQNNEFVLYYQPQMDMRSGCLTGFEALIRWEHPQHGIIYPNSFIPLAEEIGLILPIGDWVFRGVCLQIAKWKKKQFYLPRISINLSVKQLAQPDLIDFLGSVLAEYDITAETMTIEITENISLETSSKYIELLIEIKKMGFKISIDDFGIGYSNLNYLKKFSIDEIKIDKSFIDDITSNPHDKAISTTIIAIAHSLGFKVVAEGVETLAQLTLLAKLGCDIMQGFYFSKPLNVIDVETMLRAKTILNLDGIVSHNYQRTILLVDDEIKVLSALKRMLRHLKVNVIIASSAQEALELLALHDVGVILSDLLMPEVNGIQLLDKVYQMYPNVIRMILSGTGEFDLVCEAVNTSAIHKFIIKPWEDTALIKNIEDAFLLHENLCERY